MANPTASDQTTLQVSTLGRRTAPVLFQRREYIDAVEASTTTCVSSTTSPVKEYTPDD